MEIKKKPLNSQQNSKYLDLEDFPFVPCFGGGVFLDLAEKSQKVWIVIYGKLHHPLLYYTLM